MARALLGHLGGNDPHTQIELVALRRRVAELQGEVADLRSRLDDQETLARLDDQFAGAELSTDQLTLDETPAFGVISV
jgi:hypothetical protein